MSENFDNMTPQEFEDRLPELIASGPSDLLNDPKYTTFFEKNPNCSALVRDLAAIADAAKKLLQAESEVHEEDEELPGFDAGDPLWDRIKGKLDGSELEGSGEEPRDKEPKLV